MFKYSSSSSSSSSSSFCLFVFLWGGGGEKDLDYPERITKGTKGPNREAQNIQVI